MFFILDVFPNVSDLKLTSTILQVGILFIMSSYGQPTSVIKDV